jgi:hypothetical protein
MGRTTLGAIALLVSGSAAFACGTERWPVKTGTDRDAGSVANFPKPTTIAQLRLCEVRHDVRREHRAAHGSLMTRRWRKADSNPQSRFGKVLICGGGSNKVNLRA